MVAQSNGGGPARPVPHRRDAVEDHGVSRRGPRPVADRQVGSCHLDRQPHRNPSLQQAGSARRRRAGRDPGRWDLHADPLVEGGATDVQLELHQRVARELRPRPVDDRLEVDGQGRVGPAHHRAEGGCHDADLDRCGGPVNLGGREPEGGGHQPQAREGVHEDEAPGLSAISARAGQGHGGGLGAVGLPATKSPQRVGAAGRQGRAHARAADGDLTEGREEDRPLAPGKAESACCEVEERLERSRYLGEILGAPGSDRHAMAPQVRHCDQGRATYFDGGRAGVKAEPAGTLAVEDGRRRISTGSPRPQILRRGPNPADRVRLPHEDKQFFFPESHA